jgi:hypothetical protein
MEPNPCLDVSNNIAHREHIISFIYRLFCYDRIDLELSFVNINFVITDPCAVD